MNPLDGLGTLAADLELVRAWISDRHNWTRVGWAVGGFILLGIGMFMVARPVVEPAAKTAAKGAATAAKVAAL